MKRQYLYFLIVGLVIGFVRISQATISWPAAPSGEPANGLFMTYINSMLVNTNIATTDGKVKKALDANTLGSGVVTVSAGNVGISTPSPQAKLDVTGTVRSTNLQVTNNAATGSILISDQNGNATWQPNNYRLKVKSLDGGISDVGTNCMAMEDDTIKCWGYNSHGQIGIGDSSQRNTPTSLYLTGVKNVYSVGYSTFALMKDGSIYSWGYNGYGELGLGDTSNRYIPTKIPGITNATDMLLGIDHGSYDFACALLSTGTVKCWGYNGYGQLGDGTATSKYSPVDVVGLTNAVSIKGLGWGSTGHSCALKSDGTVMCWGYNGHGQLGVGDTTQRNVPTTVSGLTNVRDLYVMDWGSCVVLTDNVTVKCWGYNGYGQLCDGTTTNQYSPVTITTGGSTVKSMAFSRHNYNSSFIVFNNGTVKSCGYNGYGQLGLGDATARYGFVAMSNLSNVKKMAIMGDGSYATACALMNDGTVKCWGYNGYGQIGDGTTSTNYNPQKVLGLTNVVDINMGGSSNVYWACALITDGSVRCWGYNGNGQLGQGDTLYYSIPVSVKNLNAD